MWKQDFKSGLKYKLTILTSPGLKVHSVFYGGPLMAPLPEDGLPDIAEADAIFANDLVEDSIKQMKKRRKRERAGGKMTPRETFLTTTDAPLGDWICQQCTFINENNRPRCAMCDLSREDDTTGSEYSRVGILTGQL